MRFQRQYDQALAVLKTLPPPPAFDRPGRTLQGVSSLNKVNVMMYEVMVYEKGVPAGLKEKNMIQKVYGAQDYTEEFGIFLKGFAMSLIVSHRPDLATVVMPVVAAEITEREEILYFEPAEGSTVLERQHDFINPIPDTLTRDYEQHALSIMSWLMEPLARFHEAGLIHRDVKASNIVLHRAPNETFFSPRLIDFDLTLSVEDAAIPRHNECVGTYYPPELKKNNRPTFSTDIYAAGIMLYELLTKTDAGRGFPTYLSIDTKKRVPYEVELLPAQLNRLPESVRNILLKATHRDPSKRYTNSRDMLNAITESLSAFGQSIPPSSQPPAFDTAELEGVDLDFTELIEVTESS